MKPKQEKKLPKYMQTVEKVPQNEQSDSGGLFKSQRTQLPQKDISRKSTQNK